MDLVAQVIEGEHAVEKHQHAVGNVEVVDGVLSYVLQAPHDVIGAIADRAGGERRQTFHSGRAVLLQQFLDDGENISGEGVDFVFAFDRDFSAPRFQGQKGAEAKKRVTCDFFSTLYRIQQAGIG